MATELREIKNSNSENFVKVFCLQAKENEITLEELIKLVKKIY